MISFLLLINRSFAGSILNIPIKSLTNSNIIYTEFTSSKLETLIINDRLDYNQFYIDLTIIGKENQVLKLSLDTTMNTNLFDSESCPYCLDNDPPVQFITKYKGNSYKISQFSADVLLNDDEDLILSDFPVNLQISDETNSSKMPFDGVFGLGLDSFSRMPVENSTSKTIKPSNLLNYLWKNDYIESRKFSFALYKDANKTKLIMGGYDGTLLKSPFDYHPIRNSKHWALNLSGILIDRLQYNESEAESLIFDSSVSNLIGPKEDVLRIIKTLNAKIGKDFCEENAQYFMKCNCINMPFFEESLLFELAFNVSGQIYPFYLEDLLISYEEDKGECNFALNYPLKPKAQKAWVAGTKFFERYYVMFNADNKEIAIAEVNLDVLMGLWFLSEGELEFLSILGFLLFMASLTYFMYVLLKDGKSSKNFVKISNSESEKDVGYLEDSDIFVIGKEMKEIKKEEKLKTEEINEKKETQNVENIEDSNTV